MILPMTDDALYFLHHSIDAVTSRGRRKAMGGQSSILFLLKRGTECTINTKRRMTYM